VALLPWGEAAVGRINLIQGVSHMAEKPKLSEELKKMEYEPLLPVEKQLIGWSVGIGTALLVILYWVSVTFFPAGH
jgi:hypothetical protein